MGSLRKILKTRLPALATLWSASGGPREDDDDDAKDPERSAEPTYSGSGDSICSGSADPAYSRPQKPDSTYELMRECPEIIEEVVERRYNTGTIVKPHMRHGLRRLSVQEVFGDGGTGTGPADTEDTGEDTGEAAGKAAGDTAEEATSDSGMSSGKGSDAGDTYAVPKSETYEVPRGAVGPSAVTADGRGAAEDEGRENREDQEGCDSEDWSCDSVEGRPTDGNYCAVEVDEFYVECVRDPPTENVYLEPKTVQEIERDRQKLLSNEPCGRLRMPQSAAHENSLTFPDTADEETRSELSLRQNESATAGVESHTERSSTMPHKARSLQNLQQCFIEIQTTEPKTKSKGSFRLHPKPKTKKTRGDAATKKQHKPTTAIDQSISENFVLRPSKQFESYGRPLRSSCSLYSSAAVWESAAGGGEPWHEQSSEHDAEAARLLVDGALEEAFEVGSRGSTLERGYERLPLRCRSVDPPPQPPPPPPPPEPLYANSCELQRLLLEQLREQTQLTDGEAAESSQAARPPEDPIIAPRGKRKRRGPVVGPRTGDRDRQAQPEQTGTQLTQAEALIALKTKDSKFACVRIKPAARGRGTMRKSCSMTDIGPVLFTPQTAAPPPLPSVQSPLGQAEAAPSRRASSLEEAGRSVEELQQQTERTSRPASAASSAPLTVWLAVTSVWVTVCGWVGAAGSTLGHATAPLRDWLGVKYMSVHRNHPWLPDLVCQPDLDYWIQRTKKGSNGFEELRKYIKHGGDFCKDLASILQERSDLEVSYAKGLQKLAAKLLKASKEGLGSVNQAWHMVGAEMEYEADVHKTLAVTYTEELVKPLRGLLDSQHKARKSVETDVDKTAKNLAEWRSAEAKAKKLSYQCARENERAEEQALEARLGHGSGRKEAGKVENRRQKTENALAKADTDYYNFCLRSERARLEWETALNKGSQCFQTLEEERLIRLRSALQVYHQNMTAMVPKMAQSAERLSEPVSGADVSQDVQTVLQVKRPDQPAEQLLPDFYAEDMTNAMNRDRRKKALEQFVQLISQDVGRERRGKHGVENLAKAMQEAPQFSNEGSQKDVYEKLQHLRSMLGYLEASRFKVQAALAETEGQQRPQHPLSRHIQHHKDRQGMVQSVLKVPSWVKLEPADASSPEHSPDWNGDRGRADGTSQQPHSDIDELSSEGGASPPVPSSALISPPADSGSDQLAKSPSSPEMTPSAGRCQVLYDYKANMNDELTIKAGDVISVHDKQQDGWWLGELKGTVGIFPATYVRELI